MAIPAPVILLPTGGVNYTTDVEIQTISGSTSSDTYEIHVNGSSYGVSYTEGETVWSWTGTISLGTNTLNVTAIEQRTLQESPPATIVITLVQADIFVTVAPPTGTKLLLYQDKIEVITAKNPELQVVGYNFYVSTRSNGIDGVYVKINGQLITDYSFYEDTAKLLNRTVDTAGNVRVTTTTEEIERVFYYSVFFTEEIFNALVQQSLVDDVPFNDEARFFFVVTALIYDPTNGQVTESAYSAEMEGSPIIITTGIRDLPARTQSDIILTFSTELLADNQSVDTKPGTVLRDEMDTVSEETARMYVIQDFLARANSVSTLLDFDDSDGDGVSDPVSSSQKKRLLQAALNFTDVTRVQQIIDDQFDKLASDVYVTRKGATPAIGTVIFYVEIPPVRDMYVYENAVISTIGDLDAGIASQSYQTITSKIMEASNIQAYYNSTTRRYELQVDVKAINPGEAGNTDSYTIRSIGSGVDTDFRVENPNPIAFGAGRESNHDLARRIMLAFFVDTGTEGGYARIAIGILGVRNVRVEKAKDPLMIRDYDTLRKEHIGGKVDIYIQGSRVKQVSDQIAFAFESVSSQGTQSGEIFQVANASAFQFKCTNPRVSAHTPIFEVTEVYNSTRAQAYDLAGYQVIGDGNVIDLNESLPLNVTVGLASSDVIRVNYKYRSSDTYLLKHQPVKEIISVVGQLSGDLPPENYELVSLEDPLANGGSTIASDGLRIIFANGLPLTGFQTIVDEPHVMIVNTDENLNYLGVDPTSIIITSIDKSVTYVEGTDYRVTPGTETTVTSIRMIESGSILNGQQVLVNYIAIENFTITYTTNDLLNTVQEEMDKTKHACADVIVKQAVENKIDFVMTVIPKTGVTRLTYLTSRIQTAVANYIGQLDIGTPVTQSEVIHVIQNVADVDYVVVPFSRMIKADGSFIVRDHIGRTQFQIYNQNVVTAYITTAAVLTYKTMDKGGPTNRFRGIFEDEEALILQEDPLEVSGGAGRAYILSDGRLVVSTKDGLLPDSKNWDVAYYVYGETGSNDINVESVEYLTVGNFSVIYDDPRTQAVII